MSVDQSEDMETSTGYAKETSEDYKKTKRNDEGSFKKNDIVICAALIPGKPAPRILTEELVKIMKPGSIIYDLAAEQGGNSAYSETGKINDINGVKVIGVKSLMNRLPLTASSLYSKKIYLVSLETYIVEKKKYLILI